MFKATWIHIAVFQTYPYYFILFSSYSNTSSHYKDWNMLGWKWMWPFLLPFWHLAPVNFHADLCWSHMPIWDWIQASVSWGMRFNSDLGSEDTDLLHCLWSEGSWGDRKRGVLCEGKNCDPKKQQFEGNSLGFSFPSVTCKDSGTVDTPECSGQGHLASVWEKYLSGWGPSSLSPLHAWGLWYWIILDSFLIDPVPFLVSKLLRTDFLLET